ncbi:MAG: NUDIX domain-containing protein [Candidatus Diapherotrites archaeon]
MSEENLHAVTATAIVIKDGKYLITKRALTKKAFPGLWTVPGGNLELSDYKEKPKDTSAHWYNILEKLIKREVKEETGLEIKNIGYLTSITFIKPNGIPGLIFSFFADYDSGEISLNEESVDYAWVSLEEAKNYELIEGIYEELIMLDKLLKENKFEEWRK